MCGNVFHVRRVEWCYWEYSSIASLAVRTELGTCCNFVPKAVVTDYSLSPLDRQAILVYTQRTKITIAK